MKTAVILHGNMRTFSMPIRENPALRICDIIYRNIVQNNEADVFLVTDTTNFYHDGVQLFDAMQREEIEQNKNKSFDVAFCKTIDFIDSKSAKTLIQGKLDSLFGSFLKSVDIYDIEDVSSDPKFLTLSECGAKGCTPNFLVSQYLKIKRGGELLEEYERTNNIHYDIIFRGRLDNKYSDDPLLLEDYDYNKFDIFVPNIVKNLFVYDWAAFGTRRAMDISINLYDKLGYTLDDRVYRCECAICKKVSCGPMEKYGITIGCECNKGKIYSEMTLAPEYHLLKLFQDYNIRCSSANIGHPYRYR